VGACTWRGFGEGRSKLAIPFTEILVSVVLPGALSGLIGLAESQPPSPTSEIDKQWKSAVGSLNEPDLGKRRRNAERLVELAFVRSSRRETQDSQEALRSDLRDLLRHISDRNGDGFCRGQEVKALTFFPAPVKGLDIVPQLLKVLQDEKDDEQVRIWIAMALPELSVSKETKSAIIGATGSRSTNLKVNAIQQLGRLGIADRELLALLAKGVADPNGSVRNAWLSIAELMTIKGNSEAIPFLLRGLNDPDAMVRRNSLLFFESTRVMSPAAEKELTKLLEDKNEAVRVAAAIAMLKATGDKKYLDLPVAALASSDAQIRSTAAQALALCGKEAKVVENSLRLGLNDPSDSVRVHCAYALSLLTSQPEPFIRELAAFLESENELTRQWAVGYLALAARGARDVAEKILFEKTKSENRFARGVAIGTLVDICKDMRKLEIIGLEALDDRDPTIRLAGLLVFSKMGKTAQRNIPRIERMLADSSEQVRDMATRTLLEIEKTNPQ
jgi:HEAT repeat protein